MRERIRINGEPISEDKFAKYSEEVWKRLEDTKENDVDYVDVIFGQNGTTQEIRAALKIYKDYTEKPTFYRYFTLVAFHAFMIEKVDVAIIEVGRGGEFDSTNVIEKPVVCGITSLGLDHMNRLGNTIDQIAWHKAGIIKVPVVAIDQVPEALAVIQQRAKAKKAHLQVILAEESDRLKDVEIGKLRRRTSEIQRPSGY
ncbi:Folylpolyglutamate synthetase [Apophysomyces ossiformis]|uniref:Folylpolyglutamate synthetase n=1 Tax=Apophysomyces ossiformis TaxID=679940 RepID=A0A8H7BNF2_9FUNG|nr:Folylpolyglutamate synthetase [Apophysomyces ossiformis]